MSARILIVEDDPATSRMVSMALKAAGYLTTEAKSCRQAKSRLEENNWDLLLCDLYLGDGTSLELLEDERIEPDRLPMILFTAHGSIDSAVEAIRRGAFDYLAKPFKVEDLLKLVKKALENNSDKRELREETAAPEDRLLVGNSPPMVELYKKIALAARTSSPVLIAGETGTGKELVARSLHEFSNRKDREFVAVNCGAVAENLLESELFGHEKGSFTGASRSHIGLFEQASGGTLFLDEISETTPGFQVKLLRALQEQEIRPIGSRRMVKVDVRIVAATNREPEKDLESGSLRRDLFYRLSVIRLEVPPLRKRTDDIPKLADHFLRRTAQNLGRNLELSEDALELLKKYEWPGNVRELENIIERIAVLKTGSLLTEEDFACLRDESSDPAHSDLNKLDQAEREKIIEALRNCNGVKAEAARQLGIPRRSLYRKVERLKIDLGEWGEGESI